MLALAVPTALLLFLLFLVLWLAGEPIGDTDELSPFTDFMVAAFIAAAIALLQLAALGLLKLLPWPDPRLTIDRAAEEDRLKRVFE